MYNKTSKYEIFSPSNKTHREGVGRAKDLSALWYSNIRIIYSQKANNEIYKRNNSKQLWMYLVMTFLGATVLI